MLDDEDFAETPQEGLRDDGTLSDLNNPCKDEAYNLEVFMERDTFSWEYNLTQNFPGYLDETDVRDAITQGFNHVENAHNDCGRADSISAVAARSGATLQNTNITADGICHNNDGRNVVKFGEGITEGPDRFLAVTCWWWDYHDGPNELANADVKFNNNFRWFGQTKPDNCLKLEVDRFGVESVMTHEAGHVFGMAHVGEEEHPNLTMSRQTPPCDRTQETLGKGDMLGLEVRY